MSVGSVGGTKTGWFRSADGIHHLTSPAGCLATIVAAGANLDTDVAAVWMRNRNEVTDRIALFNYLRRQVCAFIGIAPGPSLAANTAILTG